MIYYSRKAILNAKKHIIGGPNEESKEEKALYNSTQLNLLDNPNTPYVFHFNTPIIHFGVPTKTIKVGEHITEFIDFLMGRYRISHREAIELIEGMPKDPVRTNTLKLDAGKVLKGRLAQAIEINGAQHYCIPDDVEKQPSAVREIFCDMIKMKEMEAICPITEINIYERESGHSTVEKNLQTDTILYDFVHGT